MRRCTTAPSIRWRKMRVHASCRPAMSSAIPLAGRASARPMACSASAKRCRRRPPSHTRGRRHAPQRHEPVRQLSMRLRARRLLVETPEARDVRVSRAVSALAARLRRRFSRAAGRVSEPGAHTIRMHFLEFGDNQRAAPLFGRMKQFIQKNMRSDLTCITRMDKIFSNDGFRPSNE